MGSKYQELGSPPVPFLRSASCVLCDSQTPHSFPLLFRRCLCHLTIAPSGAGADPFKPPFLRTPPLLSWSKDPCLPSGLSRKAPFRPFMAPFFRNGAVTRDKAGHIRELIPSMERGWVGWHCPCSRLGKGRARMASTRRQGSCAGWVVGAPGEGKRPLGVWVSVCV